MPKFEWTDVDRSRLVPGARVTMPEEPGLYRTRAVTVGELPQRDSSYLGGWRLGCTALAVMDPSTIKIDED